MKLPWIDEGEHKSGISKETEMAFFHWGAFLLSLARTKTEAERCIARYGFNLLVW